MKICETLWFLFSNILSNLDILKRRKFEKSFQYRNFTFYKNLWNFYLLKLVINLLYSFFFWASERKRRVLRLLEFSSSELNVQNDVKWWKKEKKNHISCFQSWNSPLLFGKRNFLISLRTMTLCSSFFSKIYLYLRFIICYIMWKHFWNKVNDTFR